MLKKINFVLFATTFLSLCTTIILFFYMIDILSFNTEGSRVVLQNNFFLYVIAPIISLIVTIFLIALLFIVNRSSLTELIATSKNKRLTKAEERRKQQIEELEAQKEELEKKIDEMKKE